MKVGDKVGFWVVERSVENRLTLRAEMRLPEDALFDLKVIDKRIPKPNLTLGDSSNSHKNIELIQTVTFNPKGLIGYAYWFGLLPIHTVVFDRMYNDWLNGSKVTVNAICEFTSNLNTCGDNRSITYELFA